MKLVEYLENKVRKFQIGGQNILDTKCNITEESLPPKFYLQHPSKAEINSFKRVFCTIQKDPTGFSKKIFKIKDVLPISSVNGLVMVIETKSKKPIIDNQLLVKIPLSDESDSVTYEYYVGEVLNTLRINRLTDNFALVYGLIIQCGFNTDTLKYLKKKHASVETIKEQRGGMIITKSSSAATIKENEPKIDLCDDEFPNKPHIIYEYIRNLDTNKTETFDKYIDRLTGKLTESQRDEIELNIINLTIMIMYSLQVAQDIFDFTHYDLHTGNILVIELGKPEPVNIIYRGKNLTIMTTVIPHIIDYGKAYVDPERAQEIINKTKYYDIQLEQQNIKIKEQLKKDPIFKPPPPPNFTFSSFESYQEELFKNQNYVYHIRGDTSEYDKQMFDKRDQIFLRERGSELLYSKNLNKFFVIKTDKRGKYTMIDNKRYDIKNESILYESILYKNEDILLEQMDRNSFVKWMSSNIYHKNIQGMEDLIIEQKGKLLINKYDVGVHSDKPNKKYDIFRFCKMIYNKMIIIKKSNISLKLDSVWSNLDDQLDLEYPFYNNNELLPSDYHVTDFFAISDANINKFRMLNAKDRILNNINEFKRLNGRLLVGFKTYIKEPKNVAEYLADNISSTFPKNTRDMDLQHVFQIISEE